MTLNEIRDLLVTVDPKIKHYFSMEESKSYSYWEETRRLPFVADDGHPSSEEGWHFYVHLYTTLENDPKAAAFFETLDRDPRTAVSWTVDPDRDSGYIHHIFDCEGF